MSGAPVDRASPPRPSDKAVTDQLAGNTAAAPQPAREQSAAATEQHIKSEDVTQPEIATADQVHSAETQPKPLETQALVQLHFKPEAGKAASQPETKPESAQKRGVLQQTSSPSKRQKQLPKGQGQISAFFTPNSK